MTNTAQRSLNVETQALIAEYGKWVTYPTGAEITSVSVRTLKRLTAAGQLPCYRIGRSGRTLRLKTADLARLIERVA